MDKMISTSQVHLHQEAASGMARVGQFLRPVGHFVAHLAEMCMAMCAGGSILTLAFFGGAGLLGFSDLDQRFPELPILVVTVNMAVAMAAWMRFRHHPARHTVEMSGATIVVGILIAGAYWTGIMSESSLPGWQRTMAVLCGPECLVMFAVMLLQREHYTGKMHHPVPAA